MVYLQYAKMGITQLKHVNPHDPTLTKTKCWQKYSSIAGSFKDTVLNQSTVILWISKSFNKFKIY